MHVQREAVNPDEFLAPKYFVVPGRRAPVPDSEGYRHSVVRAVNVCSLLVIITLQGRRVLMIAFSAFPVSDLGVSTTGFHWSPLERR